MAALEYLFDTSICIALFDEADGPVRTAYREAQLAGAQLYISSITSFELAYGAWKSAHPHFAHHRVERFLGTQVVVLPIDYADALVAGAIRAELNRLKEPIGPYDTLIAGQVVARGLTLVTANVREFSRVEGLLWEDWSRP